VPEYNKYLMCELCNRCLLNSDYLFDIRYFYSANYNKFEETGYTGLIG